jgi:hypothetical protein
MTSGRAWQPLLRWEGRTSRSWTDDDIEEVDWRHFCRWCKVYIVEKRNKSGQVEEKAKDRLRGLRMYVVAGAGGG